MFLLQVSVADQAWQTVQNMMKSLYAHLPYLVAGLVVFLCFLIGATLTKRALVEVAERTKLDTYDGTMAVIPNGEIYSKRLFEK